MNSALGVGNSGNEDAIAAVRGAEGGSRKAIPLTVVPERGQRPKNLSETLSVVHPKEVCDVLHEDVSGSKVANDSRHLPPKRSFGMAESLTAAGAGHALAGEPAGDKTDAGSSRPNCSDVVVDGDAGEPSLEEAPSELVLLAEEGVVPAGEVESVGEEAAPVEESADDIQGLTPPPW